MSTHSRPASILLLLADALNRRHAELCATLAEGAAADLHAGDDPAGVSDFKDLAIEQVESDLRQASIERATTELASVNAALVRLGNGLYGSCLDCGDPIPEQRLLAVPASLYCA